MSKRSQLGAALGSAKKAKASNPGRAGGRKNSKAKPKKSADAGSRSAASAAEPPRDHARDAAFVGSTTTNGEIQDLEDPRVYHRKARPGAEARSVRKMSVYMDADVADRLDLARIKLRVRDRSELVEQAVEEFLTRLDS